MFVKLPKVLIEYILFFLDWKEYTDLCPEFSISLNYKGYFKERNELYNVAEFIIIITAEKKEYYSLIKYLNICESVVQYKFNDYLYGALPKNNKIINNCIENNHANILNYLQKKEYINILVGFIENKNWITVENYNILNIYYKSLEHILLISYFMAYNNVRGMKFLIEKKKIVINRELFYKILKFSITNFFMTSEPNLEVTKITDLACWYGNADMLKLLHKNGQPCTQDTLIIACKKVNIDCLKFLETIGLVPNNVSYLNYLHDYKMFVISKSADNRESLRKQNRDLLEVEKYIISHCKINEVEKVDKECILL